MATRAENSMGGTRGITELPLRSMDYTGKVVGASAEVALTLTYHNALTRPLEPIFTFPLPAEAAVLGVSVRVGDRHVEAELRPTAEARADYESAVAAGHQATMLEQHRDNIFSMSVGGIAPGEDVEVRVRYQHQVEWQGGGGRFILPLVVAPHFIHGEPREISVGRGFSPDTDEVPDASRITPRVAGDPNEITYRASVDLTLAPGFHARVASPSHGDLLEDREVTVDGSTRIELRDLRPDRDLTISYLGTDRSPQVKVDRETWEPPSGGKREYFTTIQLFPNGEEQSRARRVVLCLDCSGSMQGYAIAGLREVVARTVAALQQGAQPVELGIVKFNSSPEVMWAVQPLSKEVNVESMLSRLQAEGGTRAGLALDTSLALLRKSPQSDRAIETSIVLITDGDTSDVRFNQAFAPGVRIHAVGLSTAVDHAVLKSLARSTGGSTYWVYPGEDYDTVAREIAARTFGPVVRDLRIDGIPAGAEVVGLRDLYPDRPTIVSIRSEQPLQGVAIHGCSASGNPIAFELAPHLERSSIGAAGHLMWARTRLRDMGLADGIAELSLKYGVLSRATSFVAVLVRERPGEQPERLEIPVALPHGWEMEAGWSQGHARGPTMANFYGAADSGVRRLRPSFDVGSSPWLVGGDADLGLCSLVSDSGLDDLSLGDLLNDIGTREVSKEVKEPPLLARVRDFLGAVSAGLTNPDRLRKEWNELARDIHDSSRVHYEQWHEGDRAILFKLICDLRGYGYRTEIPQEIRVCPVDPSANGVWREAQRLLGIERGRSV